MDVRIGVVEHTLLQAKLKDKSNMQRDMHSLHLQNEEGNYYMWNPISIKYLLFLPYKTQFLYCTTYITLVDRKYMNPAIPLSFFWMNKNWEVLLFNDMKRRAECGKANL